ncbi:MAG: response regulator transcription factor [Eubacteriales bacterium]|nr:response regulator transcription factor [Eubacteriales bacterium]
MIDIKILLADDDELARNLVKEVLVDEAYEFIEAENGQQALDLFYEHKDLSLVILDIMMPDIDGITVLEEIRSVSEVPVLVLTALGDSEDELMGLQSGANDYVSKPFHCEILAHRIKNLLKLTKVQGLNTSRFEHLVVDYEMRKIYVDEEEVLLNNKEFQLLEHLIQNQGVVLSREKILNCVWGHDYDGDARTIDTHVKMLRANLKMAGEYIKTVRGVGYCFDAK